MTADRKVAALILTNGRPDTLTTDDALRRSGWTHPIYYVIDDEDRTGDQYRKRFGEDRVIEFCKRDVAARVDSGDTTGDLRTILYARNAAFDVAERLGLDYHFQLDDDYTGFNHRRIIGRTLKGPAVRNMDRIVDAMLDFLDHSGASAVACSQGGDWVGGINSGHANYVLRRKAMNTWMVRTDRRFLFVGRLNDDVNTYVTHGSRGKLFFTVLPIMVVQQSTQTLGGGMTGTYTDEGTYAKSFTTVMMAPSCTQVASIGPTNRRIHHNIRWRYAVPKIISDTYTRHTFRQHNLKHSRPD